MKKYIIPLVAIAIIAAITYSWRSSVARHELVRRQRRAHIDSLKEHQPTRSVAMVPVASGDTQKLVVDSDALERAAEYKKIWDTRKISMPDSIRPSDFSEKSLTIPKWDVGDSDDDSPEIEYIVYTDNVFDKQASIENFYEQNFVDSTVMKMLLRHLTNPADAEEFGRCPSGYFFTHNVDWDPMLDSNLQHSASDGWKYGDVFFGAGCDDSMICKYRIQYASRIVEMKDPNAQEYVSLRNYELMKFGGTMAEAIKKD